MLTLKQYVDTRQQQIKARHGSTATWSEIKEVFNEDYYREEYFSEYVLPEFNAGEDIPTRILKSLPEGKVYRLLRSTRALRDNKLTHSLRATYNG